MHRIALHALAATVLAAAAGSALAQSAEYRRGFDDGYRAAQEGRPPMAAPPGPFGGGGGWNGGGRGRIAILQADYGAYGSVCDARGAVQQFVDQQGGGSFEVTNRLCGDPASGQTKTLEVTYQCGRGQTLRAAAPEGRLITLGCR